ncbi:MAG: outer membrane protein assembly factor BamA [Candidatus Zixiibacteriota bacterium]
MLVVCAAAPASAQTRPIAGVVVQGNHIADEQLIRNVSGLKAGDQLSRESIQQAIHNVYGLGLFSDVRILGEEAGDSARVIIEVTELPRLNNVHFKGNKEIKEKDFKLSLRKGQTVSPHSLAEAERKIRQIYQEKGFFLVEVESELQPTPVTGEADVLFTIEENKPVVVEKLVFEGNEQLDDGELSGAVSNKPRGIFKKIFGGGKFNREKYAEDKVAIIDHYKKKGFLDAILVSDTIVLNEERTAVTLRYVVDEGPRYYFGETTFAGQELFTEEQLRRTLTYDRGDVFNQEKYEESIGNIYTSYQEEGYLYTRVIDETKTVDSTVNITFEISEGVPAHVRRIEITGNVKTKDKVIRRELAIFPGQVFRRSRLMRSLQNVMRLNYFGNVLPDYKVLPDGRVDLEFAVEEKPTGQIQVGGGYSGQDKFVGTVSLGIPNLFGNGQEANLSIDYGKRRQSYSFGFTEPWFLDTPTSVGFDLYDLDRAWDDARVVGTNDYTEKRTGFGLRLGRRLRWPDDYFRVYWRYTFERQSYTDFTDAYLNATNISEQSKYSSYDWPLSSSSTALTISRDTRDLPEFATSGTRSAYEVEFTGGVLGGDWSFTRHFITHARYHKIGKGFTFAPMFKIGVLHGGSRFNSIPESELFYAGGIRSDGMIRGYDDGDIRARLNDSTVVGQMPGLVSGGLVSQLYQDDGTRRYFATTIEGGRAVGIMNAEITVPIASQQIYGLLFFDAGNVWLRPTDVALFDLYTSYGFGFRLAIPGMGTLGFDFGIPLRDIPDLGITKGKLKPHFQFGGNF